MMPISFLQRGFKSQGYVVMTLDIHIDTYSVHNWVKFLLKEQSYLDAILSFFTKYFFKSILVFQKSVKFKMVFWSHRLDQNTNELFSRISALASKKMSNQKIKALHYAN